MWGLQSIFMIIIEISFITYITNNLSIELSMKNSLNDKF